MATPLSRRSFGVHMGRWLLLASAGCFQAACQRAAPAAGIEYAPSGSSFPVTIHDALGSTHLHKPPQRIITLGVGAADICLSLGVLPVAIEAFYWGGDEQGYLPWFKQTVQARGWRLPEVVHVQPELDIEKIITLKPDLVLAPQSGLTPAIYRQLASFTSVVAYPSRPWLTPMAQQIDIVAAVLGQREKGHALYQTMMAQITKIRQQYPLLQQYTFAYVYAHAGSPNLWCYQQGDQRVDTLIHLGLTLLPLIRNQTARSGSAAINIGLENADWLDGADLVLGSFGSEAERLQVEKIPLFSSIAAISRGAYVPLTDAALTMATTAGSPLSLQWGLPRFLPLLLDAVKRIAKS